MENDFLQKLGSYFRETKVYKFPISKTVAVYVCARTKASACAFATYLKNEKPAIYMIDPTSPILQEEINIPELKVYFYGLSGSIVEFIKILYEGNPNVVVNLN